MTKIELYRHLTTQYGRDISFAANVLMNGCSKPTKRLKALHKLVEENKGQVCLASFDMALLVKGERVDLFSIGD